MRIAELYAHGDAPVFSFEFFPPKTDAGFRSLYRTITDLKQLDPGFVSVTCGAAGSTRRKTADLVVRIQNEIGLTAMAHMTCTGQTREELGETLDYLQREGIENVLALRGDPPRDEPDWRPIPGGFRHANELGAFVRDGWSFSIGGACYPETHHEAADAATDLRNLKHKVDSGAEFLITQLFFENRHYFEFVRSSREIGIEVPITPGIMPIVSARNLRRIASLSPGSEIPSELLRELEAVGEDDARAMDVGVRWATHQCRELLDRGAPGIHFYTLNQSPATRRVYEGLSRQ
jgi:methylenetetrahydrofolate reductase (NADPH)